MATQQKQKKTGRTSTAGDNSLNTRIRDVAHLYRRAGFSAAPQTLLTAAHNGVAATVNTLVDYESNPDPFDLPPEATADDKSRNVTDLQKWWLQRMLTSTRPLQEKMVLFWHGHFATAVSKVGSPHYMFLQNATFRSLALGRFDDMLTAMYKDPAMLIWLDGYRNSKASPNENWGREVLELFALGRGNYSEDDVHANARAFTGWRLDRTGAVTFVPRLWDNAPKTLLGQTGNWTADDAVRIIAAHPATGPFLASRLWHFFASDEAPTTVIDRLAGVYVSSDHSIREVVRALFLSPEFYAAGPRTNHIKNPVDFIVSSLTALGISTPDMTYFPRSLLLMGQVLFNPPNVGGWSGGPTWINAGTMLERFNYASRLVGNAYNPKADQVDPTALLAASGADTLEQLVAYLAGMLGVENLSSETQVTILRYTGTGTIQTADLENKVRGIVHLLLVSPEYQIA